MPKILYKCDPEKNILCQRHACYLRGGPCTLTKRVEFAKQPVEKATFVFDVYPEDEEALNGYKGDDQDAR